LERRSASAVSKPGAMEASVPGRKLRARAINTNLPFRNQLFIGSA
jgi:hypothetical protein